VVASAPPWPQQCRVGEVWQCEHGMLQWQRGFGLPEDWQGAALSLCARQPGAMLPVAVGRKPLKKLFQEHGIPALLRNDWPCCKGRMARCWECPVLPWMCSYASQAGGGRCGSQTPYGARCWQLPLAYCGLLFRGLSHDAGSTAYYH